MSVGEAHVADLERRLAEAEDILRAIREGEVDALLVRGGQHDVVFHIGGGGESYRAFMEAMDAGAAALDEGHNLVYANTSLLALLRRPLDDVLGRPLREILDAAAAATIGRLLASVRTGRQSTQVLLDEPSGPRHVVVAAGRLPLDFGTGWALTFTDITERVEAAAAEESERIGRAIMVSANEAVVVCDGAGTITHASATVLEMLRHNPVGSRFDETFPLAFGPGAGPLAADDVVAVALSGSQVRGIEASLPFHPTVKDVLVSAAPLRHAGGVIRGCIVTLLDQTERKAVEKRQNLLMRELDHRMKNMLALVQSISARTLATANDLDDFGERFSRRIAALATTQDLLAERAWTSLSVLALLEGELAPYVSSRSPRITLRDLDVQISREAAVALGLVFHELVTNAVKYGALASVAGRVEVCGSRLPEGSLQVRWQEHGVAVPGPPRRRGFGHTVIARGLGHSAALPTALEFLPDGVQCTITLAESVVV
jgi:two-component sensor histidine kinase